MRWAALILSLATTTVLAAEVAVAPVGASPWVSLQFRKIERTTSYVALPGGEGVRATARCSASALYLPLEDVDLQTTPALAWRWRVEEPLDVEDERRKGGDDFAARVYVGFAWDPERASFAQRLARAIGTTLYGDDLWGGALVYVWTSRVSPGTAWDSPYTSQSKMVAAATGSSHAWIDAEVDVAADYRRLFGGDPPAVQALAVMTDADDTCGTATAAYGGFRWIGGG